MQTGEHHRMPHMLREEVGWGGGLLSGGMLRAGVGVGVGVGRDDGMDVVALCQPNLADQPRVALQLLACTSLPNGPLPSASCGCAATKTANSRQHCFLKPGEVEDLRQVLRMLGLGSPLKSRRT